MNERLTPQFNLNGRHSVLGVLALVCLLALSVQPVNAQVAFGSIVGNVTDASGGGMSGATVKITLIQTNDSRSVLTNESGVLVTILAALHNEQL